MADKVKGTDVEAAESNSDLQYSSVSSTDSPSTGGKRRRRSRSYSKGKKYGGKKTRGKKSKGKKGTKKRGVSSKLRAWINHVKAFSKKHGMKYNMALKNGKCKAEFHKHH